MSLVRFLHYQSPEAGFLPMNGKKVLWRGAGAKYRSIWHIICTTEEEIRYRALHPRNNVIEQSERHSTLVPATTNRSCGDGDSSGSEAAERCIGPRPSRTGEMGLEWRDGFCGVKIAFMHLRSHRRGIEIFALVVSNLSLSKLMDIQKG